MLAMAALASKSGEISRLAEPRGSVAMPAALLLAVGPKLGWTAEVTITKFTRGPGSHHAAL